MTNGFERELVIKLATLFTLSVLPSLTYLIVVQKLNRRWRSRLRRDRMFYSYRGRGLLDNNYGDRRRLSPKRYIGNASCQYNALSPYIRCAVNPSGPCQECSHYRAKSS